MRRVYAFLLAVVVAALWASVVQTQFNLAALVDLGADIPAALRLRTTLQDLAGFGPFFAAVAFATFLVAFPVAAKLPGARAFWFALAGFVGLIAAVRLIDSLVPPPVLIAATRTALGLVATTLGGALAGLAYVTAAGRRSRPARY